MRKLDYIVLSTVVKTHCATRREIAARIGYPLGSVSASLDYLIREDYLDEDFFITQKTIDLLHRNSPRRAVILAAGTGSRMVPINAVPKALMTVDGEPLIERLINQLHGAGIYNVTVVTGYRSEQFAYLENLFKVKLVHNPDYASYDSLHTLALVEPLLDNCYIVNADVWCGDNVFSRTEYNSWYAIRSYFDENSIVRVDRSMELFKSRGGNAMCGIAYLCAEDADKVRANLSALCSDPRYDRARWERALFGPVHAHIGYGNIFAGVLVMDVDTYEDLRLLDSGSRHLEDARIDLISEVFGVKPEEIYDIHALSVGMTNRIMHFCCGGRGYLMRIPGEGTGKLLSRQKEKAVYDALAATGESIADDVIYLNADTGYKITVFWDKARSCDPASDSDVAACMRHLRRFHEQALSVPFRFDLHEQLDHYEELRGDRMPFADYDAVRAHMEELFDIVENCPKTSCLSHIDAVYDNFLFVAGPDGRESVRLIDWEYAGMCDPHVDIAMFCIYAYFTKEQTDRAIDEYFGGACPDITRLKIYCYAAIAGLMWTNWCEYKAGKGVPFGAYEMRQYQYAKQFYDEAKALSLRVWPGGDPAAAR